MLQEVGLSRNEAKVYLALLRLGPSLAGEVTKKSGVHRRNVYDSIERLTEKGLVSYITFNNRKYFKAVDPQRLLAILKEEKSMLGEKEKKIQSILPALSSIYNQPKEKHDARIFKGIAGIKTIFEDILGTVSIEREYFVLGATGLAFEMLPYYYPNFTKRRAKTKIHLKVIFGESLRGKKVTKLPLAEVRYISDDYTSPIIMMIYDDKTAIILWSSEEPLALLVENKEITDGYKKYFNLVWNIAKK